MDRRLLETADSAIANDWNLPELPQDTFTHPSSSQELAEIFGTSDDEDDITFPFTLPESLPMGKVFANIPPLSADGSSDSKHFPPSLLGGHHSSLFLEPLGVEEHLPVPPVSQGNESASSSGILERSIASQKDGGSVNHNGQVAMDTTDGAEGVKEGVSEESKGVNEALTGDGGKEKVKEQTVERRVTRKSSRLRGLPYQEELPNKKDEEEEIKAEGQKNVETPPVEKEATKTAKEEAPLVSQTSEEADSDKAGEGGDGGEGGEGGESSGGEESEEEEEEESDDPEKLWCICKQRHDDRFMICCDRCEEWYHGDCVGISVGQGKRMEREGKEYVCLICLGAKDALEAGRAARQAKRELVREKSQQARRRGLSSSGHTPSSVSSEGGDQYGLGQLFRPDNTPPHKRTANGGGGGGEGKGRENSPTEEESGGVTGRCVVSSCRKPTRLGSVYCSGVCIEQHAASSLQRLRDRGLLQPSSSSASSEREFVRGSLGVSVIERATGKVLLGISAPSEKNLVTWLKAHPSFQVFMHKKGLAKGKLRSKHSQQQSQHQQQQPAGGVKRERKEAAVESPSKIPKIALMEPASVRANAKKALYQILWKRCEDAADPELAEVSQASVERLADDIEEKLFNVHGQDITPKYKNKYRSLVFNLKDTKNQGLFRKVLLAQISPKELVRMSSEKLASEDLAQWREKTIKKNLDMIKVAEEEAMAVGATIRKKTYKGDVEIEASEEKLDTINLISSSSSSSFSAGEGGAVTSDGVGGVTESAPTTSYTPAGSDSTPKPSKSETDSTDVKPTQQTSGDSNTPAAKPAATATPGRGGGGGGGGVLDLLTNTTSQHGKHVFDQHCDICTGKIPPPSTPPFSTTEFQVSPDSKITDSEVLEKKSPDSMQHLQNQLIWSGSISMAGLTRFTTIAYPVSGPMEYLGEILPDMLSVMGRIANVQVWEYLDKLRTSTSRDVVVLRFDPQLEDWDSYHSMLTYLVGKRRCGVISTNYHGIKDMYLVPLPAGRDVPYQLLPLRGPGILSNHADMLLGVVVRSKHLKPPPPHPQRRDSNPLTAAAGSSPSAPSSSSSRRHHSFDSPSSSSSSSAAAAAANLGPSKPKKSRFQIQVGFGDRTPPILDSPRSPSGGRGERDEVTWDSGTSKRKRKISSSFASSYEQASASTATVTRGVRFGGAVSIDVARETDEEEKKGEKISDNVQMSFYGQHQPLAQRLKALSAKLNLGAATTEASSGTSPQEQKQPTSTENAKPTSSGAGIQSILSTLSDEKLREIASAMSSLGQNQASSNGNSPSTSSSSTVSVAPSGGQSNLPAAATVQTSQLPGVGGSPSTAAYHQQQGEGGTATAPNFAPVLGVPQNAPLLPPPQQTQPYFSPNQQAHYPTNEQGQQPPATVPQGNYTLNDQGQQQIPPQAWSQDQQYYDSRGGLDEQGYPSSHHRGYSSGGHYDNQGSWEGQRHHYGNQRGNFDSQYSEDDYSRLDRIESRDYGHKSHDWRRGNEKRGSRFGRDDGYHRDRGNHENRQRR